MSKLMNIHFAGAELMTGLPEYRNGGLFIDTGVLTLRESEEKGGLEFAHKVLDREGKRKMEITPMFSPDDDVVVEWRAATVGLLDLLLDEVNLMLGLHGSEKLTLPQMLEAGSWKVRYFYYIDVSTLFLPLLATLLFFATVRGFGSRPGVNVLTQGGREMAEISRPNTQCPPIAILSDGTVF